MIDMSKSRFLYIFNNKIVKKLFEKKKKKNHKIINVVLIRVLMLTKLLQNCSTIM